MALAKPGVQPSAAPRRTRQYHMRASPQFRASPKVSTPNCAAVPLVEKNPAMDACDTRVRQPHHKRNA